MDTTSLIPVIGVILSVSQMDCCNQILSLNTENGVIQFVITPNTYVVNSTSLRAGMRVVGFYDGNLPTPLIFPPRYQAEIISQLRPNEQVTLRYFDQNLVAADNSLQLTPDRRTTVVTANGQRFTCSPGGQMLLVYYTTTTRSLPPQTVPRKIVVLC